MAQIMLLLSYSQQLKTNTMKQIIFTCLLSALSFNLYAGQVLAVYPTSSVDSEASPSQKSQWRQTHLTNYYGISYSQFNYSATGLSSVNTDEILLHLGAHLTPKTAIEGRIGLLGSEETVTYGTDSGKQKINHFLGGYIRYSFFNFRGFDTYGLAGITQTESQIVTVKNNLLYETKKSSMDISYGLGTRVRLGQTPVTANLEYTHLVSQKDLNIDAINLGIQVYF